MLKTVSTSFINSELVRAPYSVGCFQICSGNNNTSSLLYTCDVIHLRNKGVSSPYVQKYVGIHLKFNILRLHYTTYYYALIEWKPF